jgi:hypothetical protein
VTDGYQEQWQAYRVRKRNLTLLLIAQFLGIIPFLTLVAFIDRKVFSATSLVMPAAWVWGLWYISTAFRLRIFPCPRCGKNFLGGMFTWYRNPRAYLFGRECFYCGLRKFANSEPDDSRA